jgi:hypothetical protein
MLSIDVELSSSRERRILKDREVSVLCCSSATAHGTPLFVITSLSPIARSANTEAESTRGNRDMLAEKRVDASRTQSR